MIKILDIGVPKQIIYIVLILVLGFILYRILKKIVAKALAIYSRRSRLDARKQKIVHRLIDTTLKYTFIIIILLALLGVFHVNTAAIITSIGVVGLVIGFALQDIFKDILASLFIILENQYAIGDIIEVSGFKGEVVSISLKSTKIKAETGEIKFISNRNIMEVINYSMNDVTAIIDFTVAYESDMTKVEEVNKSLVPHLTKNIKGIKGDFIFKGIQTLGDTITYRLEVLTTLEHKIQVQSDTLKEIKTMLDNNGIKRK